jgi:CRP/FNR family transcriptional regulator, anaerobic regulatory protein
MEKLRKHINEIIPISDDEFEFIKTFFTIKKVLKNQYLINQGDEVKYEYIIMSGIFRVFYLDENGNEHIIQFATENWWMSDYISYFNKKPANMYVVCMVPGEVLCLTLSGREKLSSDIHKMEYFFRFKLTKGYIALQRRIMTLLSGNPEQRYNEFADLYPNLMQKIPKKYIAEYLGVSRETLSRLYSKTK